MTGQSAVTSSRNGLRAAIRVPVSTLMGTGSIGLRVTRYWNRPNGLRGA